MEDNTQLYIIQREASLCTRRISEAVIIKAHTQSTRTQHTRMHIPVLVKESEIKALEEIISKGVSTEAGVFVRALEKALKEFHVQRQAYWSGAFVGNHVHKTLKVNNIQLVPVSTTIIFSD